MSATGIIVTRYGVFAVQAGPEAVAALKEVAISMADDVANLANHAGDVQSLVDSFQASLNSNGLDSMKILGAAAFGTATTIALAPVIGAGLGAATLSFGAGLAASWIYEKAFDQAKGLGENLTWEDPVTPPNFAPSYPSGDKNGNGLPDILESLQHTYQNDAKKTISPIILDLDGDGVETTAVGSGTYFDHNANGFAESTGWASSDDGLLVRDINGNGHIDSGRELFGSETLLKSGALAAHGFAALAELDLVANGGNADGKITAADAAFATLKVWKDTDADGYTSEGELFTLAEAGVSSINVTYTDLNPGNDAQFNAALQDSSGNTHQLIGSYTNTSGLTRTATDVWFAANPMDSLAEDWVAVPADIAALPDLRGYGNVYDLHQAMARDTSGSLTSLVTQLTQLPLNDTASISAREALTTQILYAWTGADAYAADSRGDYLTDARHLYVIEALMGEDYVQGAGTYAGTANAGPNSAIVLEEIYSTLHEYTYSQLTAQTALKPLYDLITYSWDETSQSIKGDLTAVATQLTADINANRSAGLATLAEFARTLKGMDVLGSMNTDVFQEALAPLGADVVAISNTIWAGLVATGNDDTLTGGSNGEYLNGLAGNDSISGNGGDDFIKGNSGNDSLNGGAGNDTYLFERGDGLDTISDYSSTQNQDVIRFAAGISPNDVTVTRGAYHLYLSYGNGDRITLADWYYNPAYRIESIQFDDGTVWTADSMESRLTTTIASSNSDILYAGASNDTIDGLGGNDTIYAGDGNDSLYGGSGYDSLEGGAGADTLDGGIGNDWLQGGAGNDTYLYATGGGIDTIFDNDSTAGNVDVLKLGADITPQQITVTRDYYNIYLTLNGSDQIILKNWYTDSSSRVEQVQFTDGTIWDAATLETKANTATALADYIKGGNGSVNDSFSGLGGNDLIYGMAGNDTLNGDAGNDTLDGGDGNDTLIGGSDNDTLEGGAGDDILDGGIGNDGLNGGAGNDRYLFAANSGQDTVNDTSGANTIQMAAGILPQDIRVSRDGYNNLNLHIDSTGAKLTLQNWFSSSYYQTQQVVFADGTTWNAATLNALAKNATAYDDYLVGTTGTDTFNGLAGNDTLVGGAGNDSYFFARGSGQDVINDYDSTIGNIDQVVLGTGITPDDIVLTGAGGNLVIAIKGSTDSITVQNWYDSSNTKIEQIKFENGVVWGAADIQFRLVITGTVGNDTLYGSSGNDVFDGGAGNDNLYGRTGNNTYLFGRGDGQDYIRSEFDATVGKLNTLQLKAGITTSDIILTNSIYNNDLTVSIAGSTDKITIQDFFLIDEPNNTYNPIQQIKFDDGSIWNLNAILAKLFAGTEGVDSIEGTVNADMINGLGGNDTLYGNAGNDTLEGGAGNDTLYGNSENDILNGGAGSDKLYGDTGNDILNGGIGDDSLSGEAGNDTYLFGKGDGQDTINYDNDSSATKFNILQFKADVNPDEVIATRSGSSLVLTIIGTTDKVIISDYFYYDTVGSAYNPIQQVKFSDGTAWGISTLTAKVFAGTAGDDIINGTISADIISGQNGNDTLSGGAGDDQLFGNANNDTLNGNAGNDTLDGGAGSDTLWGNAGNDTYLFGKGDGQDFIAYDYDSSSSKLNILQFKAGVLPSEVTAARSGDHLVFSIAGTTDTITAYSFFYNNNQFDANNPVQQVRFDDGTVWSLQDIVNKAFTGSAGNDTINGTISADTIYGGAGNDTLNGNAGNDTLDGGIGNDMLWGNGGNDTYLFGKGDGQDGIAYDYDTSSTKLNILQFKAGVAPSEVISARSGNTLVLSIANSTDTITIFEFFYNNTQFNPNNPIQQVRFDDGTVWNVQDLVNKAFTGSAGNDNITGTVNNDIIDGRAGNDTLSGGAGNDTYLFGKGDGQDGIAYDNDYSSTKLNTLQFKAGVAPSEVTAARSGNTLVLSIANSTDKITISDFFYSNNPLNTYNPIQQVKFNDGTVWSLQDLVNKTLTGTAGNDTISGTVNNDTLDGSAGTDTLIGGAGNDTYIVDLTATNALQDTITETAYGGMDTLRLRGGAALTTFTTLTLGTEIDNLDASATGTTLLNLTGNTLNNALTGNAANNTLNGGAGTDTMAGGTGNDTYMVDNLTDIIVENANEGTDIANIAIVTAGGTYTLASDVENGTLTNTVAFNLTGNVSNNILTGNAAANTLNGGLGADRLIGGVGNDIYVVDDIGDVVVESSTVTTEIDLVQSSISYTLGANIENLTLVGTGAINGTGNTLNNTITGNASNNTLNGGAGTDAMAGGIGNDTYVLDNLADSVFENSDEGTDLVNVAIATAGGTYTLASNVENATVTSTVAYNLIGNASNNTLTGNAAANTLNGNAGADTLVGGAGNDIYVVDDSGDVIIESSTIATEIDLVQSSISFTLGANLEKLTLTGTAAINGTGNTLNNTITGNAGNNTLDGSAGTDTLIGGAGNDTYVVDLTASNTLQDTITEAASGGVDTVRLRGGAALTTFTTLTLGAEIDNLDASATGTTLLNLTGNALNNALTGNAANNTLNGGAGADTMAGGAGNDTYMVDNLTDVIIENANEGTDLVNVAIATAGGTYTLGANVENGTLTNTVAYNLTGNASNNILKGNAAANKLIGGDGNDVLNGLGGSDNLIGGMGDDIYTIDVLTDVITENANEGSDLVNVAIATAGGTYTLATNVENAALTNTVAYNLTGNTQDNVLIGNGFANNIKGNDGNDTLNGGLGNDILTGGLGNDLFSFTSALSGTNIDTISDFLRGTDDIALHATIFTKLLNDTDLSDNLVVGGTGVKALDANDYLIFNSTTKALYYDADGSGAGAAVQFATLTNVTTVSASDFVVL